MKKPYEKEKEPEINTTLSGPEANPDCSPLFATKRDKAQGDTSPSIVTEPR